MQLLEPDAVVRFGWLEVEEVLVVPMAHLWINDALLSLSVTLLLSVIQWRRANAFKGSGAHRRAACC